MSWGLELIIPPDEILFGAKHYSIWILGEHVSRTAAC